jgi:hypothetical protein
LQVLMHVYPKDSNTATQDLAHFRALELHIMGQSSKHTSLAIARRCQRPFTAAFCGEPIHVHVTLHNPLSLPLALRNVRLACSFENRDPTSSTISDESPFKSAAWQRCSAALCVRADESEAAAGPRPIDVMVPAAQSLDVALELKPREEGWLCVEGLRWDLVVPGRESAVAKELDARPPHFRVDGDLDGDGLVHVACVWKPRQHLQQCGP